MDVGQEKLHGAALGDFPGFVQILLRALGAGARAGEKAQPGAGEEAAGKMVLRAGAAEAGHGGVQFAARRFPIPRSAVPPSALRKDRRVERGAAQREVVEGDVEEQALCHVRPT